MDKHPVDEQPSLPESDQKLADDQKVADPMITELGQLATKKAVCVFSDIEEEWDDWTSLLGYLADLKSAKIDMIRFVIGGQTKFPNASCALYKAIDGFCMKTFGKSGLDVVQDPTIGIEVFDLINDAMWPGDCSFDRNEWNVVWVIQGPYDLPDDEDGSIPVRCGKLLKRLDIKEDDTIVFQGEFKVPWLDLSSGLAVAGFEVSNPTKINPDDLIAKLAAAHGAFNFCESSEIFQWFWLRCHMDQKLGGSFSRSVMISGGPSGDSAIHFTSFALSKMEELGFDMLDRCVKYIVGKTMTSFPFKVNPDGSYQVPFFGKGIVVRGSPLAMASNPTVVCEACQVLFGVNIQESEIAHALNLATLYVDGFNTSNPTKANPEDNVLFLKGTAVTYYGRALLAALGMLIDEGSTESSEKLFEPAKAKAIEILEGWTKNGPPTSEDPKEAVYIGTAVTVKVLCELYDRGRCPPVYDGMLPFVVADLFDGKTLEEVICLIHDKYYVKNGADLFKQAIETLRER